MNSVVIFPFLWIFHYFICVPLPQWNIDFHDFVYQFVDASIWDQIWFLLLSVSWNKTCMAVAKLQTVALTTQLYPGLGPAHTEYHYLAELYQTQALAGIISFFTCNFRFTKVKYCASFRIRWRETCCWRWNICSNNVQVRWTWKGRRGSM